MVHDANSGALLRVMNRNTCFIIDRSALDPGHQRMGGHQSSIPKALHNFPASSFWGNVPRSYYRPVRHHYRWPRRFLVKFFADLLLLSWLARG